MSTSVSDYISYFKLIAKEHKSIGNGEDDHFFGLDPQHIGEDLSRQMKIPALVIETPIGYVIEGGADNVMFGKECAVLILGKPGVRGREAEQIYLDGLEVILKDIIKRMRHDKRTPASFPFHLFDLNSCMYERIYNIYGLMGWRLTFRFASAEATTYDTSKWI